MRIFDCIEIKYIGTFKQRVLKEYKQKNYLTAMIMYRNRYPKKGLIECKRQVEKWVWAKWGKK